MKKFRIYEESTKSDTNYVVSAETGKKAIEMAKNHFPKRMKKVSNKNGGRFYTPKFWAKEE